MQKMSTLSGIKIKEKANLIEAASALLGQEVEMANRYRILDHASGREIFYAVEQTGFCGRNLKQCCADCAGWEADILYTEHGAQQEAFHLERPWTLDICCMRPRVHVTQARSRTKIGTLVDPCTCIPCRDIRFHAHDARGDHVMTAAAGCCQWGLCCPCPCGPCSRFSLNVEDADGRRVGHLHRQIPGPCTWFFVPDVDHYIVEFGDIKNPSHKVLLMSMALFLDFRYFNNNSWDDKETDDGGDE